jgi:hypothetical protein
VGSEATTRRVVQHKIIKVGKCHKSNRDKIFKGVLSSLFDKLDCTCLEYALVKFSPYNLHDSLHATIHLANALGPVLWSMNSVLYSIGVTMDLACVFNSKAVADAFPTIKFHRGFGQMIIDDVYYKIENKFLQELCSKTVQQQYGTRLDTWINNLPRSLGLMILDTLDWNLDIMVRRYTPKKNLSQYLARLHIYYF